MFQPVGEVTAEKLVPELNPKHSNQLVRAMVNPRARTLSQGRYRRRVEDSGLSQPRG